MFTRASLLGESCSVPFTHVKKAPYLQCSVYICSRPGRKPTSCSVPFTHVKKAPYLQCSVYICSIPGRKPTSCSVPFTHVKKAPYQQCSVYICSISWRKPTIYHCKNKLVVLTTEWLPWLQMSWRDSGYVVYSLLIAYDNHRAILQPGSCS